MTPRNYCILKKALCTFSEVDDAPRLYELTYTYPTLSGDKTVREGAENGYRCRITGKQTVEMVECPITSELEWQQVESLLKGRT